MSVAQPRTCPTGRTADDFAPTLNARLAIGPYVTCVTPERDADDPEQRDRWRYAPVPADGQFTQDQVGRVIAREPPRILGITQPAIGLFRVRGDVPGFDALNRSGFVGDWAVRVLKPPPAVPVAAGARWLGASIATISPLSHTATRLQA